MVSPLLLPYSMRNAFMGSTAAARRAGKIACHQRRGQQDGAHGAERQTSIAPTPNNVLRMARPTK